MAVENFTRLDSFSYRYIKRAFDLTLAVPALVFVVLPLIPIVALAIWLDDGGVPFYSQERIGRHGKPFRIWKFRSMRPSADHLTALGTRCDSRSSSLGKFLRNSNIDELPQLWNIIRGDMSIVGPRPERPVFVARYSEEIALYCSRHAGMVGLTGLAQICGLRGDTSIPLRAAADVIYLESWSITGDLRIVILTLLGSSADKAESIRHGIWAGDNKVRAIGITDLERVRLGRLVRDRAVVRAA